jgi:hypothetical protein
MSKIGEDYYLDGATANVTLQDIQDMREKANRKADKHSLGTEINDKGGKQSKTSHRFDLLDAKAMFLLGRILKQGAKKYGDANWKLIDVESHLNHALGHIMSYLEGGDVEEDHLGHAFTRLMMAIGVRDE